MKQPLMRRVAERVEAYKKENPMTPEQIMNTNLMEYYSELTERFGKEIMAEDREEKEAVTKRDDSIKKMINEFKAACTVGLCLDQWKGGNNSQYEKWQTKKGIVIIEVYEKGHGFEVYKSSPSPSVKETIDFINA